jgi:NAD(P) transhydrogenase subunit alpha
VVATGAGAAVLLGILGAFAPAELLQHMTVFVLAVFVGWQVIWNVTPALHTPLMSVTNAISGIILVGGMLQAGSGTADTASVLGAVAILLAAINVFGGFLVTQRMLQMFRK